MKTYTALIIVRVCNANKTVKTEIKADSSTEAKWLLQAIYGFTALNSAPVEKREILTTEDLEPGSTPEQLRISNLKAAKDRAGEALQTERDKQRRTKALQTLKSISTH